LSRRVVILGAGITGVLTGRALRSDGWDVVVLEAHTPGAGSSSRTAAGCRQQFSTPSTVRGMRHSVGAYRSLGEQLGQEVLLQRGYLFLVDADGVEAAQARIGVQQEAGLREVRWLTPDEVGEIGPAVDPDQVAGATWCPTDGFLLPQLVYQEGARLLREAGGTLVARAPVTGAERSGGRIVAVDTPRGRFEADLFVDATNAWTGRTATLLQAEPLPVVPTTRFLWFLARGEDPAVADLGRWPMVISPSGVYARPENAGTLLMGWARGDVVDDAELERAQDAIPAAYAHDGGLDVVPVEAWMALAEAVPAVAALAGLTATAGGLYAITPDHNPFLAFDTRLTNLIRLVGFSGHGAMFGPFTATVAAAMADAGRTLDRIRLPEGDVDLTAFHIGRPLDAAEAMVI